jgi:signal transduction histidine kinase
MFHQIRTPLNIISGFAQVLRDAYGMIDEEEKNTITREMLQNSQTITNIMDNWMRTLALEDIQLLERKDAVFCSYICMQAAQKVTLKAPDKVKLEVVADTPDNLVVMTDKECLLKVLTELLFNANKFTSEGTITLRCEQTDRRTVRFIVKDTGPGIPEADRERIFTQFTKLNDFNEGLGMGLSLCQRLATLLGGSLVLDKEYRDGACFILELPIP